MRTKLILGLAVVLVLVFFMFAFSQGTKTVKGELVNISCYVTEGAKDKECTGATIKPGEPIGLLEAETGKLYLIPKDQERIMPFASKMVEVTGIPHERSGLNVIEIKDIKEIGGKETEEDRQNKELGY